ncbi:MAG: hypothetical protein IJK60_08610 [Clostridia bacterium]|nr:hypothetical protein [Clostridia bacterium]
MTLALIIRSLLEFTAVVLAIAGFIKREELLDFENKLFRAIGIHWRNYRRRKQYEKLHAAREIQSRAPADLPEEEIAVTVVSAPAAIHRVA